MDENSSILENRVVKQQYNGDLAAYKKDLANKTSSTFGWNDIRAHALVLPEYEEEALRQIEFQLGYLPPRHLTLPDEPFIRHALYRYDFEHNDFEKLCEECVLHIINVHKRCSFLFDADY